MRWILAPGLALLALSGAAPTAAALPFEQDWKRAARDARLAATPAPGLLPDFAKSPAPGGGSPGVGGYFRRMPRKGRCPAFTYQYTYGFFRRDDGALLTTNYSRKTPACSRGRDDRRRTRIRRVRVLGKSLTLNRIRNYEPNSAYEIRGRLNGRNLVMTVTYQRGGVSPKQFVLIARSLRWIHR